jgi:hypothetical protein
LITSFAPTIVDAVAPTLERYRAAQQHARLFETLVLQVLELEAKKQARSLEYPYGPMGTVNRLEFDALLPQGLDNLEGPLAVEVRHFTGGSASYESISQSVEHFLTLASQSGIAGVLYIHDAIISDSVQQQLDKDYLTARKDAPTLTIWGPVETNSLLERHSEQVKELLPQLSLLSLEAALQRPAPDWRSEAKEKLGRIHELYHAEGLTLVVGSGISAGMGLPTWDELVGALFVAVLTKRLGGKVSESQAMNIARAERRTTSESPLLSARYLRIGLGDGATRDSQAFQKALTSTLYGQATKDKLASTSPLLVELAKLCMPLRTGPKVDRVVTYNFDDLLEEVLTQESVEHRSIYYANQHAHETELPIYHVHGFLPREPDKFDHLNDAILAFSEEGYHQLFRDPYHWANVIQLQAFQQQTCLLVGLSLTDPNLRRLLEYAALGRDRPKHFAFMKRTSVDELQKASDVNKDNQPLVQASAAEDFLNTHHNLQEEVLRELGVEVVWFERFEEMPDAIEQLRRVKAGTAVH